MDRYRSCKVVFKGNVVDACVFAGGSEEPGWPKGWIRFPHQFSADGETVFINILGSRTQVNKGDWVAKDQQGNLIVLSHNSFVNSYVLEVDEEKEEQPKTNTEPEKAEEAQSSGEETGPVPVVDDAKKTYGIEEAQNRALAEASEPVAEGNDKPNPDKGE